LAAEGAVRTRVYSNDRCPAPFPPYDTAEQRLDLQQLFKWTEAGASGCGPRGFVCKLFLAGGGQEDEFDAAWHVLMQREQDFKAAVEQGRFCGSREMLHYRPEHRTFRVVTTAVHEVGHTLGLDHCVEPHCVMNDAEGSIETVDHSTGKLGQECRDELDREEPRRLALGGG
jgi:hypothetical protein